VLMAREAVLRPEEQLKRTLAVAESELYPLTASPSSLRAIFAARSDLAER
jgi:hypothetical protein